MVHWLELSLQTRAYVLVDAPESPRCVILGFHGYAERPAHCLEGLRKTGLQEALLVGAMGQHHFYNRDGKVVASWMTKFNREHQVQQILDYARRLLDEVESEYGPLPLFVFGFSQGASTAYRVAALSGRPVQRIFALAGDLPPELVEGLAEIQPIPVTILHGSDDSWATAERLGVDRARLEEAGWRVECLEFEGGHEYLDEAMAHIGHRISGDLAQLGG